MKKLNITQILHLILSSAILSLILVSCETEPVQEDFNQINLKPNTMRVYEDCASVCLEADSDDYFVKSENQTGGNKNQTKSVTYFAYNTQKDFVVEVLFEIIEGNAKSEATIIIDIDGDEIEFNDVASGTTVSHSIPLVDGWAACDVIPFFVRQEALTSPFEFDSSYSLVGMCPEGCEEMFSYELNEDSSYTFTYISEETLSDAEVTFTCPHITDFESLDGKLYDVNPGKSNGAPTVLTYVGDIEACTPITFMLSFDADCDQNAAGFANMFTDFKVNDVSKKGDNENIRFNCND